MVKLLKIFRIYSLVFIAFGIISVAFSAISDILGFINENIEYDAISSAEMIPFINGGVFIIIGGLLQTLAGLYGYKAAKEPSYIMRPIILSVFAIAWQITGFIILYTSRIINIRLFIQVPMTFIYLVLAFMVQYKTSNNITKKHIEFSHLSKIDIEKVEKKVQKRNIVSIFQSLAMSLRPAKKTNIRVPSSGKSRHIKRVNIKPVRKFKR